MRIVLAVALLVACGPGPGETKCRTTMFFGVAHTKCETGAPEEVEVKPVGYWCSVIPASGLGVCDRQIGECEAKRHTTGDGGPSSTSTACEYADAAVCAATGCFPNIASCAHAEARDKRGPNDCAVMR